MLLAAILLLPPAEACQCIGADATQLSPAPEATGVPTNAKIWVWAWQGLTFNPDDWAVSTEAGEPLGPWEIRTQGVDQAFVLEFSFPEELPPNTVVKVIDTRSLFEQIRFTTGDGPDHEAPTWGGKYTVDLGNDDFCDERRWISFFLEDAQDNSGQELVVQLIPKTGDGLEIWGTAKVLGPYWSGLCGGDESLEESFHRSYDVTIYDVAGNKLDAGVVSSCGGCQSGGPGTGLGLVGVLSAWSRRRRAAR